MNSYQIYPLLNAASTFNITQSDISELKKYTTPP